EKIAYLLKSGETEADLPKAGAAAGQAAASAHGAPPKAAASVAVEDQREQPKRPTAQGPQGDAPARSETRTTGPSRVAHAPVPAPAKPALGNGHARYSPVVKRLAKEHEVDPAWVKGSGLGGRVTRDDMLAYVADLKAGKVAPPRAQAAQGRPMGGP